MAIVKIVTTQGALPSDAQSVLAIELAKLTYEVEGFTGSAIAPSLCWTFFDERPARAFSTGAGDPAAALYYVTVTALAGAMSDIAKRRLGAGITAAVLAREGAPATPHNRNRIWVRIEEIADGNLIVGGEPGSLASLKALVAEAGQQASGDIHADTFNIRFEQERSDHVHHRHRSRHLPPRLRRSAQCGRPGASRRPLR